MKRKLIGILLVSMLAAFVAAGCGENQKVGLTVSETLSVSIGERVYWLEDVRAVSESGENIAHLVRISVPSVVTITNGYYVFPRAGSYLVSFEVDDDGTIYTAQTTIIVTE